MGQLLLDAGLGCGRPRQYSSNEQIIKVTQYIGEARALALNHNKLDKLGAKGSHKRKNPADDGLESPCSWPLEAGCRIFLFMCPFGPP